MPLGLDSVTTTAGREITAKVAYHRSFDALYFHEGACQGRYQWYLMFMTPEELKALRARLGLTQQELAEKVGVARNTINRWEMGIRSIPEPVVRLMDYLTKEVRAEIQTKIQRSTRRQAKK